MITDSELQTILTEFYIQKRKIHMRAWAGINSNRIIYNQIRRIRKESNIMRATKMSRNDKYFLIITRNVIVLII